MVRGPKVPMHTSEGILAGMWQIRPAFGCRCRSQFCTFRPSSAHDSHISAAGAFRRRKCHASKQQPVSGAQPASEEQSGASSKQQDAPSKPGSKKKLHSSWDAKEAGRSGQEGDFLSNLGSKQDYNINVTHGQGIDHLDSLFVGNFLGRQSDIGSGELRDWAFRKFNHLVGDYYVAPSYLDAVAVHITKNFLMRHGAFGPHVRVPLIMGIWGPKGQGKSFQAELVFKKLGIEPIIMSAGELEHEWAGTPGRLIRERYRRAAEIVRVRGKMSVLMINDIDAGLGHFDNTQVTVNNQMVVGTLMNICDDPTRVSIAQEWRENDRVERVPIIVTGNDLSKIFAPLVRDGRMDKFYWKPTRIDLINILHQMYRDDGLTTEDIGGLIDNFPGQPLDFFGALRASTYDNQIRRWITEDVIGTDNLADDDANWAELGRRLVFKDKLPVLEAVTLTLKDLVAEGDRLAQEQDFINQHKLSEEYMKDTGYKGKSLLGLQG